MSQSAQIRSFAPEGVSAIPVDVEAVVTYGNPLFATMGVHEDAVREIRDRVRCAIDSTGLNWPPDRIVVALEPQRLRKDAATLDLAVALAILDASGQLPSGWTGRTLVFGELGLTGKLHPVRSAVAAAELAASKAMDIICPFENAEEAATVPGVKVFAAETLTDVVEHLRGHKLIQPYQTRGQSEPVGRPELSLSDIQGNDQAKQALIIAAAQGRSLLLIGPPGSSKTMLARRMPGLMPEQTDADRQDVLRVYSAAGLIQPFVKLRTLARPFRAPHHSISDVGLLGGGLIPRPGEVTLAHRGVLFLDEVDQFRKGTLEGLARALRDGFVEVSRAGRTVQLPCKAQLIATLDPTSPVHRPLRPEVAAMFEMTVKTEQLKLARA